MDYQIILDIYRKGRMKNEIKLKRKEWYNTDCTSNNNACPLSITIKVSNINGWEYR
mgnify:FL=1